MPPHPTGRRAALAEGPEFDLIRRFLRDAADGSPRDLVVAPGDDCAVVRGSGIALSTDMSVEEVHFRRDWLDPAEIGWRAAAAALSDLAAIAARPIGILVSLAVPAQDAGAFAAALMDGCRGAVEALGGTLLGGDLARSPGPVVVDVTAVGDAPAPILRSGASPGDGVWVTGVLGGAAAFVAAMREGVDAPPGARARFARPAPRIAEALWLRDREVCSSMLDLSDGIAGDAAHLAAASGVAVILVPALLPLDPAAGPELALFGGEDYELCFTARDGVAEAAAPAFRQRFGIPLTRVGRVESGGGVWLEADDGTRTASARGWQHFGGAG